MTNGSATPNSEYRVFFASFQKIELDGDIASLASASISDLSRKYVKDVSYFGQYNLSKQNIR